MNILINAVAAKSGGAATYAINLAEQLAKQGSEHRYVFYVPPGVAKTIRDLAPQIEIVESIIGKQSVWSRFFWDQVVLRSVLKQRRVDVLISSSDFGMFFCPCEQILLVRNPLFFSRFYIENIYPRKSLRSKLDFILRRALVLLSVRFADVVMTASSAMMEDLQHFARQPVTKLVVNPFGVPWRNFCSKEEAASQDVAESFRILYVSEYGDYKNFTALYQAAKILAQAKVNFILVTTADPRQNQEAMSVTRMEDQALADDPEISPFLQFSGYVAYASVTDLYTQSDLFVFPSFVESFGHPLVEAMASGLPVLASDIPVCREICGDAALYFNPCDVQDLANKILRLKNDPHLQLQLGEIGHKRAKTHFDWDEHVRRLIALIEEVGADA